MIFKKRVEPEPEAPAIEPVRFVPVEQAFVPQTEVTMTRDVTGWVNKDKGTRARYHLSENKSYFLDQDTAAEFIVKGYATGTLPREVTPTETEQWRAESTTISIGT